MLVTAIDPGFLQSAYIVWDGKTIISKDIVDNKLLLLMIRGDTQHKSVLVIEQIKCYGMPIGQTTLDTIFWYGQFWEAYGGEKHLVPRIEVKKHICNNGKAKDSNIIQALADRFACGIRNRGKGIKSDPGFFHGFHDDIWQAFALAVTYYDQTREEGP